jgi:hypothetical protein
MPGVFLAAQWRWLLMLNYEVSLDLLEPLVPRGTSLDLWEGRAYVSLVGFMFLNTRVLGVPVPFHRNFEEANLRFYVSRPHAEGARRGVVFIKEIVPRWAIAATARWLYNENYVALPMRHAVEQNGGRLAPDGRVEYGWTLGGQPYRMSARAKGAAAPLVAASEAEFITEHYWGYCRQRHGGTIEYQVTHPRWNVWSVDEAQFEGDAGALYGRPFAEPLSAPPCSAFIADGSAITVGRPVRIA